MPGISLICDLKYGLNQKKPIKSSLESLLHFDHYKYKHLLNNDFLFLGYTFYDGYPLSSFEDKKFVIYLEGYIYGKDYSVLKEELITLAKLIFLNPDAEDVKHGKIIKWLLDMAGEFVIFILHKTSNEVVIINDILGRLPVYYYTDNGKLIISRELRFIVNQINSKNFDRMAIAQYLLFGYPLGKKTIFENIYRLEPATIINVRKQKISINNIYYFNFEEKKYNKNTIKENAGRLVDLFDEACKQINSSIENCKKILSLSGGLDSRSVGACLKRNNVQFYGASFDLDKMKEADIKVAEQLANIFDIDWKVFQLTTPTGKALLKLLKIKTGLNYLGMSFILQFFDKIREAYSSNIVYFTGDGGDKVLAPLLPSKKLKNIEDLVDYIIMKNQIFSLDNVASLTQITKNKIIDELKNHVLFYPEKDWNQKYVHFLIYERGFKLNFEGEDRNRCYFWSIAPFYFTALFEYAMNCPDEQKSNYALYREFLLKLLPEASTIKNANWNLPITSKWLRIRFLLSSMYQKLPRNFKENLKRHFLHRNLYLQKNNSNLINCLKEQIDNCEFINGYIPSINKDNFVNYNKGQLENLFTITSCVEEIKCGQSTIGKYHDDSFI